MKKFTFYILGGASLLILCVVYFGIKLDNKLPHEVVLDTNKYVLQESLDSYLKYLEDSEEKGLGDVYQETPLDLFLAKYPVVFDGKTISPDPEHFKYLTAPFVHKRVEWRKELGYFVNGEVDNYASYSIETLEALGDQGDLVALEALANIYFETVQKEQALQTLEKAAIHGSTNALYALGALAKSSLYSAEVKGVSSGPDYQEGLIGWLSYSEVAIRRGDLEIKEDTEIGLKVHGIELSEPDKIAINLAADEIYSRLNESRQRLGLGEFNNEIPDYVSGYYQNLQDLKELLHFVEQHQSL